METSSNKLKDPNQSKSKLLKIIILILIILGFITTFSSGYYLHDILKKEQLKPYNSNKNTQKKQTNNTIPPDTTQFVPNKKYFEDSIMLVAKNDPHITLIATVSRQEANSDYMQDTRVSFYDGNAWIRLFDNKTAPDENIKNNNIIQKWNENIDPSRVLKENLNGNIVMQKHNIKFSTDVLKNEISIRSLPGYAKFLSNGYGTLTVDGHEYQVYGLYTKIFSLNASDISFYNQPALISSGLTTDWLAFWDTDGNFYHIDTTDVTNPTQIYKPHKIGIFEDNNNILAKTFDVFVTKNNTTPPNKYNIILGAPINQTLNLNLLNSINKDPGGNYKWFLGQVRGSITKNDGKNVNGIGIVEYIHN